MARTNKVTVGKDGVISINGRGFFPNGIMCGPDKLKEFHEAGFNTVMPDFEMFNWGRSRLRRLLDEADRYGMKVVMAIEGHTRNFLEGRDPNCRKIREMIKTFKDHPAVLVWWPTDEPDQDKYSPEGLAEVYRAIKQTDPNHPVVLNVWEPSGYTRYIDCYDILCTDHYMEFNIKGGWRREPLKVLKKYPNLCINTLKKKGVPPAVWYVPQAYGVGGETRTPTLKEYRAMVYLPVIYGAKAIIPYLYAGNWFSMEMNPQFWLEVRSVVEELAFLAPVLAGPNSSKKLSIEGGVGALLKAHRGELYLIAANHRQTKVKARFAIPGLGLSCLNVLSEGREVAVRRGAFTDAFEPYQTHIYTTRKRLPRLVIAELLGDPRYGDPAAPQQDDLALLAKGASASASYHYAKANKSPDFAINGDRRGGWFLPKEEAPGWIEVKLPRNRRIARIVVYSWTPKFFSDANKVLSDYRLQYERNGRWVTIDTVRGNRQEVITHRLDSPITTRKIRLKITKGTYVSEIEVYGP